MKGNDVYQIYLSDGYFKYLPDFNGVNEVVIVAEFTEVSSGTKGDTVTTVLGPFEGVSDNSKSPVFNKLLYGPKKLESDQVSVTITVIEYDQGENEDAAAFLDFITSASQIFSFINPVTATERAFTKEIAKSLLALNKDEVVMRVSFDLVGDSGNLSTYSDVNGSFIPLTPGNYVLINKEGCAVSTCFGYLSEGKSKNPVAYLGDALLFLPVALRRGFTDTPDSYSLDEVNSENIAVDGQSLINAPPDPKKRTYTDKTWLTLSVVKGGDPSLWEKRKLLLSADEAVQRIGKSPNSSIQTNSDYQVALQALEAARKQEHAAKGTIQLVTGQDTQGNYTLVSIPQEVCLFHPSTVNSKKLQANFYRLSDTLPPVMISTSDMKPNTEKSTPNNSCFTANANAMVPGKYEVSLFYSIGTENYNQTLKYTIPK